MTQINKWKKSTDLLKGAREWESIGGGAGEMGCALFPWTLQSGMRTESGACGDSLYHHGGMVFVSWIMVVGIVDRVGVNEWCYRNGGMTAGH